MKVYENKKYIADVAYVAELPVWEDKLDNRTIVLSGATGLIGSFLIDTIMYRNRNMDTNTRIYALGRNEQRAKERFAYCYESNLFRFISHDINNPLEIADVEKVDYVLHLASNTHPWAYANDPIGTITTNIIGTNNMLQFACEHEVKRFLFSSSNEIYGENRGDQEKFDEKYLGYIDCNTMRAGYPESKRCGEALCQAYIRQKNMDIVIARLTRSYGPTILNTDTKALSQFINNALDGKDIVLKSAGTQYYSYTYVSDAVSGLLTVLFKGECGEAYNVSDEASDVMLKDLAAMIADQTGKSVIFELPNETEKAGFSKATKARLDNSKLSALGWEATYDIRSGIGQTLSILKSIRV